MLRSVRNIVWKILNLPLHPFLVASLPAVHFYDLNLGLLTVGDLSKAVLLSLVLVGILLLLGRIFWRGINSAAMVFTPVVAVLFKGNDLGYWWSLGLLLISFFLGWKLRRSKVQWPDQINLPLNLAIGSLVAMALGSAWREAYHDQAPGTTVLFQSNESLPALSDNQSRPDIYYILVDGLGQPTMIESEYPLTKAEYSGLFTQRGFQVNNHTFANYPQTALSVAGTMNMKPVQDQLEIKAPNSQDRRPLTHIAGHSKIVRILQQWGYQMVDFPSGYPMTRQPLAQKTNVPFWAPSFVEYYLFEDGIIPLIMPLFGKGPADFSFTLRREKLNYIFDNLPMACEGFEDDEPVFVYTHILAPHPPFVFGRQGEPIKSRAAFGFADGSHWLDIHGQDDGSYRQRYADQAVWIMKRLAETIDEIVASSTREKVIIIQGDHGPGSELAWEDPEKTNHLERFGIFNAWYVSSGQKVPLYDGQTAMNTFPLLFNTIFDTQLEMLDDRLWFACMSRPYIFYEMAIDSLIASP